MVYADRHTGWIEVAYFLTAPKLSDIINILRSYFHTFGVPEEIVMDGGLNISSTETNLFLHRPITPSLMAGLKQPLKP